MADRDRKKLGVFARIKHDEENLDELQRLVGHLRESDRELHREILLLNCRINIAELVIKVVLILSTLALVLCLWYCPSVVPQSLAI